MKFQLKQLPENIFVLSFDSQFDLCMHFLRHTEFTECVSDKFRGKKFNVIDFIDWYSKQKGERFSYPEDWRGFNLPSRVFAALPFDKIPDLNRYDYFMQKIVSLCYDATRGHEFYLVGHVTDCEDVVEHELAHAFYDRSAAYADEMKALIKEVGPHVCSLVFKCLEEMGYSSNVHQDELQAYFSTGLSAELEKLFRIKRIAKKTTKPFERVFKKYKGDILGGST